MNQYDSKVQVVMDFLIKEVYGDSELSMHRTCYTKFREYLSLHETRYSKAEGDAWLKENEPNWSNWRFRKNRVCLMQLNEAYELGHPQKLHNYFHTAWEGMLIHSFPCELNAYMNDFRSDDAKYLDDVRKMCSDFLLFLQYQGKTSINDMDYVDAEKYFLQDNERNETTKRLYFNQARALLNYYSSKGYLKKSLSYYMNPLFVNQIVSLNMFTSEDIELVNDLRSESLNFPAREMFDAIDEFIKVMELYHYSKTSKCGARHTLLLLFIFLDRYDVGYLPEIVYLWFGYEKSLLGASWKVSRKVIYQFEEFTQEGDFIAGKVNYYKPLKMDALPSWCRDRINDFLNLKKKEFMKRSTIDMYRSACTRFCKYLVSQKLNSFEELTAENLTGFNLEDKHDSLEGKNAYNVRVRCFLIYLEVEGHVKNLYIHKALLCVFAKKERIVQTLDEKEVADIYEFHNNAEGAYDLRRDAMIMLGYKMGIRGSDIVKIQFSDMNWTDKTIRIIQQKTLSEELLPMPVIVGNAIFKYITKGRPVSKSPYVFIHHKVPYDRLTPSVCRTALKSAVPCTNDRGNGFHITRKTFATNLLNSGAEVGTIIDLLGHRTDSTVDKYLSLDAKRMAMCPLSFEEAGIAGTGGVLNC